MFTEIETRHVERGKIYLGIVFIHFFTILTIPNTAYDIPLTEHGGLTYWPFTWVSIAIVFFIPMFYFGYYTVQRINTKNRYSVDEEQ